jgi:hypothetical protein
MPGENFLGAAGLAPVGTLTDTRIGMANTMLQMVPERTRTADFPARNGGIRLRLIRHTAKLRPKAPD